MQSGKKPLRTRLVQIAFLLSSQKRLNVKDLQKRFEVSRRTIMRDMRSIRDAGLSVVYFDKENDYRLVGTDF